LMHGSLRRHNSSKLSQFSAVHDSPSGTFET
jgi:hypothetical protein